MSDLTKELEDTLKQIKQILLDHENRESDIPITHEYWKLLNKYRSLKNA